MIKKLFIFSICIFSLAFFSTQTFAKKPVYNTFSNCPQAVPTDNAGFCASFKSVAECHCTSSGLPKGMCQDMNSLYSRMVSIFGSLQKACEFQHDTSTQTCVDDWNCYRNGGKDSSGKLCSSTGKTC